MKNKYNVSITALAILTGSNKKFRPKPYVEEYLGTRLTYEYNVYRILDQDEAQLIANPNPFAVVVLVALAAIKNNNATDLDLKAIKHDLNLELSKRNVEGVKHKGIMNFIKYYVNFRNPKMMITFEKEVEKLQGRTTPMGTEEYLLDRFKKEGLEEGLEKGIQKGIRKGEAEKSYEVVENLLSADRFTVEEIANFASVTEAFVKKVRKELEAKKK